MQLKKSGPNWQIEKVLYSIVTMQGHAHLWSLGKNYWSLVGIFCYIHHIVLTLYHLITFCFDLYKTSWMVKISIMIMISNRIWFSFLLIKTRSFMNVGLWCCLKDSKRSLIKMGNTLQNKIIYFHEKIVFDFLKKIRNYLIANPIYSRSWYYFTTT